MCICLVLDCILNYIDDFVNVIVDFFYINLIVFSFDYCLDFCIYDYKCLGVSYDFG